MLGHGPRGAACDDEPDDGAVGEAVPDGAVIEGVVVLEALVAAVATVMPSPRARPAEPPTIPAASNSRLCLMVLLLGLTSPDGPGMGDEAHRDPLHHGDLTPA